MVIELEQIHMDGYIAGFFDGDGHIVSGIQFNNNSKPPIITPGIKFSQSYIGGMVDSEGSLTAHIEHKYKNGPHIIHPGFRINLGQKDSNILYLIKGYLMNYGIASQIYIAKKRKSPNHQFISSLTINKIGDTKKFLEIIYPYTFIKKPQIKIMLEEIMPRIIHNGLKGSIPKYTKREFIEIMHYVDQMSALKGNQQGKRKYTENYFRELWGIWD